MCSNKLCLVLKHTLLAPVSNQWLSSGTWCTLVFAGFHCAFPQYYLTLLPTVNISIKEAVQ